MSQNYLVRAGGVVDRVTIFVYLITVHNLFYDSKTNSHILCARVSPKKFLARWTPPFQDGGVSDH